MTAAEYLGCFMHTKSCGGGGGHREEKKVLFVCIRLVYLSIYY